MSIDSLNAQWSNASVLFEEGPGGFVLAKLSHGPANATIALHGAHVLTYEPTKGDSVLWLSNEAIYQKGKAIRGGIPICWPWFANHPTESTFPAHGFARTRAWEIIETSSTDAEASINLRLQDSEETRVWFPHGFELQLCIRLADTLTLEFTITNPGTEPFSYTGALHTYFAVSHIDRARVEGLDGRPYIDSLDGCQRKVQSGPIRFAEEVDRIYLETEDTCRIVDDGATREVHVSKEGSASTVIWNPWIAKAQRMADFGDAEYQEMLCVETTNAADDGRTVPAGESHRVTLTIRAV